MTEAFRHAVLLCTVCPLVVDHRIAEAGHQHLQGCSQAYTLTYLPYLLNLDDDLVLKHLPYQHLVCHLHSLVYAHQSAHVVRRRLLLQRPAWHAVFLPSLDGGSVGCCQSRLAWLYLLHWLDDVNRFGRVS
jgi:acetoacetate decarboxylase